VALGAVRVRALPEVTVARFQDILPVEADLARGSVPVEELDLRFRDQVIARTP
jgi:cell division protein FtsQ